MRVTITHETRYRYETPPLSMIGVLRLTPPSTATQTVRAWRIDVSSEAPLKRASDAFGNVTHTFTAADVGETLEIVATGTVDTEPGEGVVLGTPERQPLEVFLRETDLTRADAAIDALVREVRAGTDAAPLARAHALNLAVAERIAYEQGLTDAATTAADALAAGHGVCQDLAHVLVAAARSDGLPARYVAGYRHIADRPSDAHESHAWAEIHVAELGWVGFDPTERLCPTEAHVRVAVGLDAMGAAPLRGTTYGGAGEMLDVRVIVERAGPAGGQSQRQGSGWQSQNQGSAD